MARRTTGVYEASLWSAVSSTVKGSYDSVDGSGLHEVVYLRIARVSG